MDARTDVEKGLPGRHVTDGPWRAPHRSCHCASWIGAGWLGAMRLADAPIDWVELTIPGQAGGGPVGLSGRQVAAQDACGPAGTRTDGKTSNADPDAFDSAGAAVPSEITGGDLACMTAFETRHPIARHLRRRDVVTRRLFQSAAAASGGSAPLSEPAIAHEAGNNLDRVDVFKKTPCAADLKPAGRDVAKDMFEDSNIPLLMKTPLDHGHLRGVCLPADRSHDRRQSQKREAQAAPGQGVAERQAEHRNRRGGRLGGQPLPEGAIVTVAGMSNLRFIGPAGCSEPAGGRTLWGAEATVIRDERPHGDPGIADTLYAELTEAEQAGRRSVWLRRGTDTTSGTLWMYAQQGAYEKQCDADI